MPAFRPDRDRTSAAPGRRNRAMSAVQRRWRTRERDSLPDRHRAPLGPVGFKYSCSGRRFHGLDITIADPSNRRRQLPPHAFQQLLGGTPKPGGFASESSGCEEVSKDLETPGQPARILELLAERERLGGE